MAQPASDTPQPDAAPPPAPLDVVLTSVVMSGEFKVAIVLDNKAQRTQSVRLGSSLEGDQAGWKLVELAARKAVFEGPTGRSELDLRVFDGTGGQAPTALAAPAVAAAPDDATKPEAAPAEGEAQTPESRAELIRKRIEERRRQMREEAERANKE